MDHDAYRRESRSGWDAIAAVWGAAAEAEVATTMPVSEVMVDHIAPQPGQRILELACGTGDVGLLLAELVAPHGEVVLSDFAPGMLTAAQERAAARGLTNVRFKQIDAESIDLEAASLDAVACRWGFMLMADPAAALRECRRVLRPGRPLVLAVWASWEDNPWRSLIDRAVGTPPPGDGPGQFAWADPSHVQAQLDEAGFVEHEIEPVGVVFRHADTRAWLDSMTMRSNRLTDAVRGREEEVVEALEDLASPHRGPDGSLALPGRTWVAWANA